MMQTQTIQVLMFVRSGQVYCVMRRVERPSAACHRLPLRYSPYLFCGLD